MFRFSLGDLRDRAFEVLAPPALEGFFIASPALMTGHRSRSREHRPWAGAASQVTRHAAPAPADGAVSAGRASKAV
jgi:hypothetical protein